MEPWLETYLPVGGDVALDIGANRGEWTRRLARLFRVVYAVEPNPALGDGLRGLGVGVELLPVGAWDAAEWRTFTLFDTDVHTSALGQWDGINASPPRATARFWCQPVDAMPIGGRVDFVKMDVEAAELHALRGATRTILRDRPYMIVEIHGRANGVAVQELLTEWNYHTEPVRYPFAHEGDALWGVNYWLICRP